MTRDRVPAAKRLFGAINGPVVGIDTYARSRSQREDTKTHRDPQRSGGSKHEYGKNISETKRSGAGLRTQDGVPWAIVSLYREPGRSEFDDDELALLLELAPYLAEGTRRGMLIGEASDPEGPYAPGLLILRADASVESMTPGVERWLAELPDGDWQGREMLPSAVIAVARRALRTAGGVDAPGEIAFARVLSQTGRWIVLHGAALVSDRLRRAAVIIEPAHPARISPLLMAAYGLSEREQDVTRLVLQGASTSEIAERLHLSAHTVQDHLKSVFEKTGVRSRRDLVGKVFFAYYEPRLRDNERRVSEGQMVRGGPLAPEGAPSGADP